jgi:hypothetical protein
MMLPLQSLRAFLFLLSIALVATLQANAIAGDCIAIEFTADGNKQCDEMRQCTDQAIKEGWVVRRIDPKSEPHVAARWHIQKVPTTVLVRNGREMDRVVGPVSYRELQQRLTAASSVETLRNANQTAPERDLKIRSQSQLATVPNQSGPSSRNDALTQATSQASLNPRSRGSQFDPSNTPTSARDPRDATVRIRVEEPQQEGVGTGTIIDSYNGEALVLTCGHLFRDGQGQSKITIETFIGGQVQSYPGVLIDYQAKETDIGLVSFRPTTPVGVAKLIPMTRKLSEGQRVFSWGCDRGAAPTRNDSQITKLNRYLGSPNVEVDGQPVEGRSGGGLFDARGELIGVCYAADPQLKEGLYNSAEVVYQQLAKLGLQRLFNEQKDEPEFPSLAMSGRLPNNPPPPPPVGSTFTELTVVVRGEDGKQEKLIIAQPSPQLIQALREQLRR